MHEVFTGGPDDLASWPHCLQYLEHRQISQMRIESLVKRAASCRALAIDARVLRPPGRSLCHWRTGRGEPSALSLLPGLVQAQGSGR
jgi:hypothetical protein